MNAFKSEISVQRCERGLGVAHLLLLKAVSNRFKHLVKQTWIDEILRRIERINLRFHTAFWDAGSGLRMLSEKRV